nr:F0F1 ATP synthase subunit B [Microlunatus endophyticus]
MLPLESNNPIIPGGAAEIIASAVFVAILTFVVARVVMPRFEKTYADRAAAIEGGIQKAEQAQAEAAAALEKYQAQLADARGEAAQIKEAAKADAAQITADARQRAQAEADRIVAAAHSQLEAERNQIVHQLRGELGGLATSLAGRIVGESLDDDERARRTVDRFISDLESADAPAPQGADVQ